MSILSLYTNLSIFDNNEYIDKILYYDILNGHFRNEDIKSFVLEEMFEFFKSELKNKNDLFTDRESAIVFGLPSNLISGIMVGREYEQNKEIINKIKKLFPNRYVCNLDGIVIDI